jgi:tripartite-type tricarboxylate transporter receptor subunit TctC
MAQFQVLLRGEHFLLNREGKDGWYGFIKTVYVQSETADSACEYAVKQAISDPEFRASVRNSADKPPAMNVEDCAEIEKDSSLQDSPFIYTPE